MVEVATAMESHQQACLMNGWVQRGQRSTVKPRMTPLRTMVTHIGSTKSNEDQCEYAGEVGALTSQEDGLE